MAFNLAYLVNKLIPVRITGGGASEPFTGANNVTKTFTKAMAGFVISNDSDKDISFFLDGKDSATYVVKAGEVFEERFEPFITVTVLANGAPYRAYGLVAEGSTSIPTAPPPDTTPPQNVTGLVVTDFSYDYININWTASPSLDVTSYDIYRDDIFLANTVTTSYSDNNVNELTQYQYVVKAKDANGNVAIAPNPIVSATTTAMPPDTTAPILTVVPNNKSFNLPFTVTMTATDNRTVNPAIYYTLDGSTPTTASLRYTVPITISGTANVTLKAIARDTAGNESSVVTKTYTYTTKIGGTGSGAGTAPTGGQWQETISMTGAQTGSSVPNWKGTNFRFLVDKEITHVRFSSSAGQAMVWNLWELEFDTETSTYKFKTLLADGTTSSAVDTSKGTPMLVGALGNPITLTANTPYMLLGSYGTTATTYYWQGPGVSTLEFESSCFPTKADSRGYNSTTAPAVGANALPTITNGYVFDLYYK